MRIAIFGKGSMADQMLLKSAEHPGLEPVWIVNTGKVASPVTQKIAKRLGVESDHSRNINDSKIIRKASSLGLDFIVSADNMQILKFELLQTAHIASVNFHNGSLSRYRGLNIPTWVIWNQEDRHSVVWHLMHETIDAGATILSDTFAVTEDETAYSLTTKCINKGLSLIPTLCEKLVNWERRPASSPQPAEVGPYYSARSIPNQGAIDLSWEYSTIERLVRALSYRHIPILRNYPFLKFAGDFFAIEKLELLRTRLSPQDIGEVILRTNSCLEAVCSDALFRAEYKKMVAVPTNES